MNTLEIVWSYFFFFFLVTDERSVNCGLKSLLSFDLGDAEVSRRKHIRWYSLIYPNQEKQRRKKEKFCFVCFFLFPHDPGRAVQKDLLAQKRQNVNTTSTFLFMDSLGFPIWKRKGFSSAAASRSRHQELGTLCILTH